MTASPELLALITVAYLIGGFSKGALGLGLPIVALAILAALIGVKETMAISLLPSILTSIYQALAGPAFFATLKRLSTMLLAAILGIWIGVGFLTVTSKEVLLGLLGSVLVAYAIFSLLTPQIRPPGKAEPVLSPLAGGLGGIMFGMTGTYIVPGLVYLQALGMKKDTLVQAMGITFVVIMVTLCVAFTDRGLFPQQLATISLYAVVPTSVGIWIGQRYRHRISEDQFRTFFFWALLFVGLYQLWRAFG